MRLLTSYTQYVDIVYSYGQNMAEDRQLLKYYLKLEKLETDPKTNWNDYGVIGQYLDYQWKENRGRWVSCRIGIISNAAIILLASEEDTAGHMHFLKQVMGD